MEQVRPPTVVDDPGSGAAPPPPESPAPAPAATPPSPPPAPTVRPRVVAVALAAVLAALWVGTRIGVRSTRDGGDGASEAEAPGDGDAHVHYYTCGMHPWVVLPRPGPCPICGMPLVPLDPAKFTGEVTIDPLVVQNIGVRVGAVERGPLVQSIRTVGTVDYDEARVRDVNVKVAGWVQRLHVDTLGEPVRRGDPLFELYSPELYAAQQEYLLARRAGGLGRGDESLLAAARTKLRYLDVPDAEIAALEARGTPRKTVTLRSPYTGVVTEKQALEGMRLTPGMPVFRVADLSKVWVRVTLYEAQLPFVRAGQDATVTLPYLPGKELHGKVVYVYPYLDARARQGQVRIALDNPGLALKPGMYATVSILGRADGDRVLAPRESVIDTGERKVAFVSRGEGRFEPRQVRTGADADGGRIEILAGLSPGEQVVTSGQFLLDSEAKVREALAKMIRGDLAGRAGAPEPAAHPPAVAAAPVALPPAARDALSAALGAYLRIGEALAKDDLGPVPGGAAEAAAAARRATAVAIPGRPRFWDEQGGVALADAAAALAGAKTLGDARAGFARLSGAAARLARATGVPAGLGSLDELHCPMYGSDHGATWLQAAGSVRNPYFGKTMLACADRRATLPALGARP